MSAKGLEKKGAAKLFHKLRRSVRKRVENAGMRKKYGPDFEKTDIGTLEVFGVSFPFWCAEHDVRPDLIKIDVHGGEGKVLFGMQKMLAEQNFDFYFEVHPGALMVDYTLADAITLVLDSGFEMFEMPDFRIEDEFELTRLDAENRKALVDPSKWSDEQSRRRRMFFCSKSPEDRSG